MKGNTSMKSKCESVTQVALAVLEDCRAAYLLAKGFELDKLRLTLNAKARDLAFFTLDLPSLDQVLLSGLESGRLVGSGPLSRRRSKDDHRPRFFWDLWSRVFDANCLLLQDADPTAIFFLRQLCCLGKKLAITCTDTRLRAAVKDYYDIEEANVAPVNDWDSVDPSWVRCSFERSFPASKPDVYSPNLGEYDRVQGLLRRLDSVSRVLVSSLGYFNPLEGVDGSDGKFQHGPGAVSDLKGESFKYDFPTWPDRLERLFPFDFCGSPSLDGPRPSDSSGHSKLIAVPKTAKAPRLIASEPTSSQWCQQWIKNALVDRYRRSLVGLFVNTLDQGLSRSLVRQASIDQSLATLDLSSASDRVTCRHVEALCQANQALLELFHAVRTPVVLDTISRPQRTTKLRKFAAMGSALTFPVQSLFFLAICLASCGASTVRDIERLRGKVRVFGDDLIVPTEAYADLVLLLSHLGLKVNLSKSFSRGFFRESCGLDAFRGYDVTPVKPKALWCNGPEDFQSLVDTSNNLFKSGCWHAADAVRSIATYRHFKPTVVPINSGLPGLFTSTVKEPLAAKRWNRFLHRWEYRVVNLLSKSKRITQDKQSALLQFFTAPFSVERPRITGLTKKPVAFIAASWRAFEGTPLP